MTAPTGTARADYTATIRSQPIPTVKIDDGAGGFVVINASDFDAATHTLHGVPKPDKADRAEKRGKSMKASE